MPTDVQPVRDDAPNSPQEKPRLGYLPFVLLVGVLFWGGFTAALIVLWESWTRGTWISAGEIAAKFVIFPLGGILFGHLMWRQRNGCSRRPARTGRRRRPRDGSRAAIGRGAGTGSGNGLSIGARTA